MDHSTKALKESVTVVPVKMHSQTKPGTASFERQNVTTAIRRGISELFASPNLHNDVVAVSRDKQH